MKEFKIGDAQQLLADMQSEIRSLRAKNHELTALALRYFKEYLKDLFGKIFKITPQPKRPVANRNKKKESK
jgi:hypothetical protein